MLGFTGRPLADHMDGCAKKICHQRSPCDRRSATNRTSPCAATRGRPMWFPQVRGGKAALYGARTLAGHDVAVVTEGESDAMVLHQQAGDLVAVATMGSATAPLAGRWLWAFRDVRRILAGLRCRQRGPAGRPGPS